MADRDKKALFNEIVTKLAYKIAYNENEENSMSNLKRYVLEAVGDLVGILNDVRDGETYEDTQEEESEEPESNATVLRKENSSETVSAKEKNIESLKKKLSCLLEDKIRKSLEWSERYKLHDIENLTEFDMASLVYFHESISPSSMTIAEELCDTVCANGYITSEIIGSSLLSRTTVYHMFNNWIMKKRVCYRCVVNMNAKYEIMQLAANEDNLELLEWMLRHGVDVDVCDDKRRTALHIAAGAGHSRLVEVLLKNGASVFKTDDDFNTPFDLAFESEAFETADLLQPLVFHLKAWKRIKSSRTFYPYAKLAYLLKYTIYINPTDSINLLFSGVESGNISLVGNLLHTMGDVNKRFENGETLLSRAVESNRVDIVEILLGSGAIPDDKVKCLVQSSSEDIKELFLRYSKNAKTNKSSPNRLVDVTDDAQLKRFVSSFNPQKGK